MNIDDKGVPKPHTQRDKLDKRLSVLASQALSLEERAGYAEKEALLRKRIREAANRIRATRPPGIFDELLGKMGNVSPNLGGIWGRIPGPMKLILVMGIVVVVLLFVGKSCVGGE